MNVESLFELKSVRFKPLSPRSSDLQSKEVPIDDLNEKGISDLATGSTNPSPNSYHLFPRLQLLHC